MFCSCAGPCAGNTPHTHPRGSEISFITEGEVTAPSATTHDCMRAAHAEGAARDTPSPDMHDSPLSVLSQRDLQLALRSTPVGASCAWTRHATGHVNTGRDDSCRGAEAPRCRAQIDFGIVEENAGENKLHMRRVFKGETIHVPQGELRRRSSLYTPSLRRQLHPLVKSDGLRQPALLG